MNKKLREIYGNGYKIKVTGKLIDKFVNPLDDIEDMPAIELSGIMYGNDECFEGDDFYQILVAENGKIYHCYYECTDIELDCINYNKPVKIKECRD